tara:strand:+ start:1185 stop:1568 length:384 start_codon:yes stop_codon:yes gene_type:complete
MSILKEFKQFAMRGNVMDLAVAVVIGAAFGKIITSLVDGIIMPLIGLVLGGIDISGKTFTMGQAVVEWGLFLQTVIDFTIISFFIFIVIKLINAANIKPKAKAAVVSNEEKLLTEIRDLLAANNKHA